MKPIVSETCVDAWFQACQFLIEQPSWRGYTIVLEIRNPIALPVGDRKVYSILSDFLATHGGLPINTVVNTIFPAQQYSRHGAVGLFDHYLAEIYPKIRRHPSFTWGTYFARLIERTDHNGQTIYPLKDLIEKLKGQLQNAGPLRASYELNPIDPFTDIPIFDPSYDRRRPIGGPCLSHLSFKIDSNNALLLTAFYRSHFYVQRALGNLFGLAHLQFFVAREVGLDIGPLVCISSMAQLDTMARGWGKRDVRTLVDRCHEARQMTAA